MKVGKAIYNILSKSTDVQSNFPFNNTDYSPTGTELVTNGDFSAAGINLVDNPNFTDTGSELMANYDFASGLTDWNPSGVTESGGVVYINASNQSINQGEAFALGNSYKAVIEGAGDVRYRTGTAGADATYLPITLPATVYFVATADSSIFQVRGSNPSSSATVSSVSVKELGEDWTLDAGWSIGDSKAVYDGTGGTARIKQNITVTADKYYKISLTVLSNEGTGGNSIYFGSVLVSSTHLEASATPYVFYGLSDATTETLSIYGRASEVFEVTSISVQELGEGWTLQDEWSIGEDKATYDATANAKNIKQLLNFELGKSYKIQFTTSTGTAKLKFTDQLGTQLFTDIAIAYYAPNSYELYGTAIASTELRIYAYNTGGGEAFSITNILVEEMVLNKIFPELAPPDIDAPYVVYSVVSNSPSETKNANGDIDTASIEVYGFQDTYNKAVDLGVSIRAALDRKTGTYNTIEIQSTNYVNEQMDVNEARKLWAAIQDYTIRIKNK